MMWSYWRVPQIRVEDGNRAAERTGWVAPDDGLLVHDINRNGTVDNVAELFGSSTLDGFAMLETLDRNGDGKITAADEAFSELRVWRDLNQDGVSQANELFTLGELNITEISTQTTDAAGTNQGHDLGLTSLFTRTNGTTGEATNIYFQTDGQDSVINETGFTPAPPQGCCRNCHARAICIQQPMPRPTRPALPPN
jgi:hypothetical protein